MPASEVMNLYRQHKLHSGPGGPVVKKKTQATAIQISMARKEGHHIPEVKGSFQAGGLVPETGNYQVHQGEHVVLDDSGMERQRPLLSKRIVPQGYGGSPDVEDRRQPWNASRVGSIESGEAVQRRAQEKDIAARTNQAQHDEWNRAMHQREDFGGAMGRGRPSDMLGTPPQPRDIPPAGNDPHYAVRGLQGSVAQRMREQGERAAGIRGALGSFDEGGEVKQTGPYVVHEGEELTPPPDIAGMGMPGGTAPGQAAPGMPSELGGTSVTKTEQPEKPKEEAGGRRPNYELMNMNAAVAAPLARSSSNFDSPAASYKRGGTIPRTGVYRLHEGETVIPKSLAAQYRKARNG